MKLPRRSVAILIFGLMISGMLFARQATHPDVAVPPLVNFAGKATDMRGEPITGTAGITFSIYADQYDGAPLWMETQNVMADSHGHYTVHLGATKSDRLPLGLFSAGEARWLGVRVNGEEEQPRVLLLGVPYALKAADAEMLGGAPRSAFQLVPQSHNASTQTTQSATEQANEIVCSSSTACRTGFVPLFSSNGGSAGVVDSIVSQNGGTVKIAGSQTTTGSIDAGGNLNASGNVSANGNVGASTVTTVTPTGGVSGTMTGTGNGIAAVQGSATATGAAGFTFGVIGQSASDNGRGVFGLAPGAAGVGVIGETTGSSGVGVVGKTLNGLGWAFSASGNASQDRASGGWAKALVSVDGLVTPPSIVHCFNSTLPGSSATTPPCGFKLSREGTAQILVDFGFEVDDRFWSVSAVGYGSGDNTAIIANAFGSNTILYVSTFTSGSSPQNTLFTVAIF